MRFIGEMMTCAICGRQQRSDPRKTSNWRGVRIDHDYYYICTRHFPADTGSAQAFEAAYVTVLETILTKRAEGEL